MALKNGYGGCCSMYFSTMSGLPGGMDQAGELAHARLAGDPVVGA